MKKILIAFMAVLSLAACKTEVKRGDAVQPHAQPRTEQRSTAGEVTFIGPRLGFDGRLRMGGVSPGFSLY